MRKHNDECPHECNICNKSFAKYSTLRSHLKIHMDENEVRSKQFCKVHVKLWLILFFSFQVTVSPVPSQSTDSGVEQEVEIEIEIIEEDDWKLFEDVRVFLKRRDSADLFLKIQVLSFEYGTRYLFV